MVKVRIIVKEEAGVWKCMVDLGLVKPRESQIKWFQSGEDYRSEDAAVSEMKRRAMICLADMSRSDTEGQVTWDIRGDNWPLLLTESEKEGMALAMPKGK